MSVTARDAVGISGREGRRFSRRRLLGATAVVATGFATGVGIGRSRLASALFQWDLRAGTSGPISQSWHNDSTGWGNALDIADPSGGQSAGVYLYRHDSGGSGYIECFTIANGCDTPSNPNHRTMKFGLFQSAQDLNGFGDTYLVHVEPISWMYAGWAGASRQVATVGTGTSQVAGCFVCSGVGCTPNHLHQNANGSRGSFSSPVTENSTICWTWNA